MSVPQQQPWKEVFFAPSRFDMARSTKRLEDLARRAPNLSLTGFVTGERVASMMSHGAGLKLLYGFQQVDQEILRELQALADERRVVAQMKALFAGAPINGIEG